MGVEIVEKEFSEESYQQFSQRLDTELALLKQVMQRPEFGSSELCIGAELEMYLVDQQGLVAPNNLQILQRLDDPQFQPELNQFNIELNLSPTPAKGKPFSRLENEMREKITRARQVADELDTQLVPIGILPTLKEEHLQSRFMTDRARYRVLSRELHRHRGEPFKVNINGEEPTQFVCDDVTVEGANTSFQVHLMVAKEKFADTFNAAQLTMPLVTALSANSPILLGNRVWDETRIALFKQSIDSRLRENVEWREPSRVTFGHGWVRDSAWELFAETVALYPPIFPILDEEDPLMAFNNQLTPNFRELCLHMGTTWPWNRAVYCADNGGHFRIEFRSIPAGPTAKDMLANAAFAIGLAMGLEPEIRDRLATFPFRFAEYNFYRAAQNGLDAKLVWTSPKRHRPEEIPITELILALLPYARRGLKLLGVDEDEIESNMSIIERRVEDQLNPARWQKYTQAYYEMQHSKDEASQLMLQNYIYWQKQGIPFTQWERVWEE